MQAKLPQLQASRDKEAAERASLATKLASAVAENAAISERIPMVESRLRQETDALRERLQAMEAARDEALRMREATLKEARSLHHTCTRRLTTQRKHVQLASLSLSLACSARERLPV